MDHTPHFAPLHLRRNFLHRSQNIDACTGARSVNATRNTPSGAKSIAEDDAMMCIINPYTGRGWVTARRYSNVYGTQRTTMADKNDWRAYVGQFGTQRGAASFKSRRGGKR